MGIKRALWRQANFKQHSIAVKFFMKVEQKNYGNRKFRLQWRWCRRKRESPINFNVSVFMPSPSASFIYSTLHTLLCKSRLCDANSACIKLMGLKVQKYIPKYTRLKTMPNKYHKFYASLIDFHKHEETLMKQTLIIIKTELTKKKLSPGNQFIL